MLKKNAESKPGAIHMIHTYTLYSHAEHETEFACCLQVLRFNCLTVCGCEAEIHKNRLCMNVWENVPFNTKNHFISRLLVEVFLYKDSLSLLRRTLFQTHLLVASCLARRDQVTLLKLVWLRLKHGNCTDLLESCFLSLFNMLIKLKQKL